MSVCWQHARQGARTSRALSVVHHVEHPQSRHRVVIQVKHVLASHLPPAEAGSPRAAEKVGLVWSAVTRLVEGGGLPRGTRRVRHTFC
jgi:hypothetical protein